MSYSSVGSRYTSIKSDLEKKMYNCSFSYIKNILSNVNFAIDSIIKEFYVQISKWIINCKQHSLCLSGLYKKYIQ